VNPAINIKSTVSGTKETIDFFFKRKAEVWDGLRQAMDVSGDELSKLQRRMAEAQLKRKTGTLFENINYKLTEKDNRITIRAGATKKAPHARFFEKGVLRLGVQVSGVRRVKSNDVTGVIVGRQTSRRSNIRFGRIASGIKFTKPYVRDYIIKARPFINPAYEHLRSRIEARINDAVVGGIDGN